MAKTKTKTEQPADRPIPLQDPERWAVRIVDNRTELDKSRVKELVTQGWRYVDPDDLAVRSDEIGFKLMNGHVVRGEHGEEVLLKMLAVDLAAWEAADEAKVPVPEQEDRGLRTANRSLEQSEIAEKAYPAWRFSESGEKRVTSAAEDLALGAGWHDSPKKVTGSTTAVRE